MSGPLRDILVVDLTRALAGPHATMVLGDLGARVMPPRRPWRRCRPHIPHNATPRSP